MEITVDLAEEIVGRNLAETDPNYGLMVFHCYALLSKFGENYLPLVEKYFENTEFYLGEESLSKLMKQANLPFFDLDNDLDTIGSTVVASSFSGENIFLDRDGKVQHEKTNPKVFCSTSNNISNDTLNALTHEGAHIIKGMIHSVRKMPYGCFSIRTGLSTYSNYIEDGSVYEFSTNNALDEAINVLQTSDMMSAVCDLEGKNFSKESLYNFYSSLQLSSLEQLYGYEGICPFVQDLWNIPHFKDNMEDNLVMGDLSKISQDFNSTLEMPIFQHFSRSLDDIEQAIEEQQPIDELAEYTTSIVKLYQQQVTKKYKNK